MLRGADMLYSHCVFSCRELLSSTVARLGGDVLEVCPQLKDREDEEEIQKHFCFILSDQSNDDVRGDSLDNDALVLPLFFEPGPCLMLNIRTEITQSPPHTAPSTSSQPHTTPSTSSQPYSAAPSTQSQLHTTASQDLADTPPRLSANNTTSQDSADLDDQQLPDSVTGHRKERPLSVVSVSVDVCDGESVKGRSFICHTSMDTCQTLPRNKGEYCECLHCMAHVYTLG